MTPRYFLLLALLSLAFDAHAGLEFLPSPEGEVAVDLEMDLSRLPEFAWALDPFLKMPGLSRPLDPILKEGFRVQAISAEGENPMAVVNDLVVHVGDRVVGKTVLKIGQDFVLLEEKGSIVEASLFDSKAESDTTRGLASVPSAPAAASTSSGGSVRIEEVGK